MQLMKRGGEHCHGESSLPLLKKAILQTCTGKGKFKIGRNGLIKKKLLHNGRRDTVGIQQFLIVFLKYITFQRIAIYYCIQDPCVPPKCVANGMHVTAGSSDPWGACLA